MKKQKTTEQFKENSTSNVTPIEDTPFAAFHVNGEYAIVFGKHAISSRRFETYEQARDHCNIVDWEMIMNAVAIYIDYNNIKNK